MFCEQCGTQVPDGQPSCPNCGAAFVTATQQTPPVQQPIAQGGGAPVPPPGFTSAPVAATPVTPPAPAPAAPVAAAPVPAPAPVPEQAVPMPQQPAPVQAPMPNQANSFNQAGYPQPAPVAEPKKKKNRKPLIIGIAAALVVLLGIGIFAGVSAFQENQRSEAYAVAAQMMDGRQYQSAYDKFIELGDYKDSPDKAAWCQKGINYEEAMVMKYDKDYEGAIEGFSALGTFEDSTAQVDNCNAWISLGEANELTDAGQYQEAADMSGSFSSNVEVGYSSEYYDWFDKNSYGLADLKLQAGDFYGAHEAFLAIGDYEDAAARAEACKQPLPGNGVMYFNDGFASSATELVFDGGTSPNPYYVKVYSGENLVATVFVNAGGSASLSLAPGSYTFKDATGDSWFGEAGMFGDDGYYSVMLFDSSSEVVNLDSNMIYTISLYVPGGEGNVGGRSEGREGF